MNAGTLVCFAVKQEARSFQKLIRKSQSAKILVTGIGMGNAEKSLRFALKSPLPKRIFLSGFAGALNPELQVGTLLFDARSTPSNWVEQLRECGAKPATFLSSDRIAITAAEKRDHFFQSGCDAIEMESKTISEICTRNGIECITLRVISDAASEDLPVDFNALMTSDRRLSPVRLAWALAKAPQTIPALLRLGKNSAHAAAKLALALNALVASSPSESCPEPSSSRSK